MRIVLTAILLTILSSCTAEAVELKSVSKLDPKIIKNKRPVLVELFTSEGCASCPPAEELLARFENEQPFEKVELITLAFHVDYWDNLGWKDKYASPAFTQRQKVYDRKFRTGKIYTPQMVVDGDIEFIGSREKAAEKAFRKASKQQKATIDLDLDQDILKITVENLSVEQTATLFVALAEDNLNSEIRDGENSGRNLTHLSVVRRLDGAARIIDTSDRFEYDYSIQIDPEWDRENIKLVVFVQENTSRDVVAVNQIRLVAMKE